MSAPPLCVGCGRESGFARRRGICTNCQFNEVVRANFGDKIAEEWLLGSLHYSLRKDWNEKRTREDAWEPTMVPLAKPIL